MKKNSVMKVIAYLEIDLVKLTSENNQLIIRNRKAPLFFPYMYLKYINIELDIVDKENY